ncbi:MAG TPA: DUF3352 domain-containing protein [Gaiellaceae bacterium]
MSSPRVLLIGLLAGLAVATTTGCGGGGASGVSSESGASIVTSKALAFVSVDSDLGSSQWGKIDDLSHKFPGRDKALADLKKELAGQNLEWGRDIDPALGPEVDIAVARGPTLDETAIAFLTKPDDPDKFKQLVKKLDATDDGTDSTPTVYREVDGWYVAAENTAAIDRVLKGSDGALSDNGTFGDALGKLPDDAVAKAYVNGPQLAAVLRDAQQDSSTPLTLNPSALGLDKLDFIAASLGAEDDGVRLKGVATGEGVSSLSAGDFTSKLIDGVPGDAFAFLDFRGGGLVDGVEKLRSNPTYGAGFDQFEKMLGVPLADILDLLRNEVAFYARPGAGIPELSLVLDPEDRDKALATLDKLAARVAAAAGGRVTSGMQAGHQVKTIDFGQFAVHYAEVDGRVLITSGVTGIADYGNGAKLADSADFKDAKAAAGLPDSNGGFLYVDLKSAIPLIESFAGLAGEAPPEEVTANLRPLRSFLSWNAGSGDTRTFDAFLEIK